MTAVPSSGNGRLIRLTVCQKIRLRRPLRIRPFPAISDGGPGRGLLFLKSWCDLLLFFGLRRHACTRRFETICVVFFFLFKTAAVLVLGRGKRDCLFGPFYSHRVSVRTLRYQPCSVSLLLLLLRGANDNRATFHLAVPAWLSVRSLAPLAGPMGSSRSACEKVRAHNANEVLI